MEGVANGWFTEWSPEEQQQSSGQISGQPEVKAWKYGELSFGEAWPGQAFSLKIEKVLLHKKSKYQDVLVFKSESYGNVLVLDGAIQCTERDEFSYQEMLAHLPLFVHPNPKKVLIIGGGDGGILREVLKHPTVQGVTMCEIDQDVIDASKTFFPRMSSGFSDPRFTLFVGDGLEFLKNHKNQYDVIITDSSDPLGPAKTLFGEAYYNLLNDSLTESGVLSSQGESMWLHLPLIKEMMKFSRTLFPQVAYSNSCVSTYPSGVIGYLICSKDKDWDPSKPRRVLSDEECESMNLRYYTSEIHEASFVLPRFAQKVLTR